MLVIQPETIPMNISIKRLNERLQRERNLQRLEELEEEQKAQSCKAWIAKIDYRWHIGAGNGNQEETWRKTPGSRPQADGQEIREQIYLHVARAMGKGGQATGEEAQRQMDWDFGR